MLFHTNVWYAILINGLLFGVTRYAQIAAEEAALMKGLGTITIRFIDSEEAEALIREDEDAFYEREHEYVQTVSDGWLVCAAA